MGEPQMLGQQLADVVRSGIVLGDDQIRHASIVGAVDHPNAQAARSLTGASSNTPGSSARSNALPSGGTSTACDGPDGTGAGWGSWWPPPWSRRGKPPARESPRGGPRLKTMAETTATPPPNITPPPPRPEVLGFIGTRPTRP